MRDKITKITIQDLNILRKNTF